MDTAHRPGPFDRFLRLFADVRAGESGTALLLGLNVFLLLSSFYVAKVLREPLILASGHTPLPGAQLRSYTSTGATLLLAVVLPLYGALAGRVPRRRLINVVTMVFVACFLMFFALAEAHVWTGIPFYVFVAAFSVMIVAQFWAFANDVYTEEEGKRLFPIVGVGGSAGGVAGAVLAGRLIEPIGLTNLLLVAAALLIAATLITNVVDARERRRTEASLPEPRTSRRLPAATGQYRAASGELKAVTAEYRQASGQFATVGPGQEAETAPDIKSTAGPFQLVWRNRYLLLIALLVVLLNWVNTNGEFILSATLERFANEAAAAGRLAGLTTGDYIGKFYSAYYTGANVAVLVIQLFFVSRILKYLGVRGAILILPIISLSAYTVLAFVPVLAAVRWAKTFENATDYSLNNTVRGVLFLPTTREEKYKGKQVTDSFSQRAGDVLSSATVFVATGLLTLGSRQVAAFNLVLVALWLVVAVMIGRRYDRMAAVTAD